MNPSQATTPARPARWLYRACAVVVASMARVWFRFRAEGVGHVPRTGAVILASNHVSFADPPLIGCALPRGIYFLARKSLFDIPGLGWIIRQLNAVPVDRDGGGGAGLKTVLDRLAAGEGILLFPEGTRSPDGTLKPARAGIGLTVIKSDAPVIPVRVVGGFEAWGRHHAWPRPRRITVIFGAPMDFAALRAESHHCGKERLKSIYQEVADTLMASIDRLGKHGP
ncbi:MAG: lysophospholipid acyltransferase family protein [Verrucomicrobiota bacterium]|jgi:1-acyl-sn-glycerol-3-phosphate acyltransferase